MFAGRFGAIAASRRNKASSKRKEAAKAKKEARKEVQSKLDSVMARFDTNKSGKLEKDQVREMLTEFDYTTPAGHAPTDEEVDFVLRMADQGGNEAIDREELVDALAAWNSYLKQKGLIDAVMVKYDTDQSGALNREQVAAMLTELNEGQAVHEEEVERVMAHCDISGSSDLKKAEVLLAVNYWYSEAAEDDEGRRSTAKPGGGGDDDGKSGCCDVM